MWSLVLLLITGPGLLLLFAVGCWFSRRSLPGAGCLETFMLVCVPVWVGAVVWRLWGGLAMYAGHCRLDSGGLACEPVAFAATWPSSQAVALTLGLLLFSAVPVGLRRWRYRVPVYALVGMLLVLTALTGLAMSLLPAGILLGVAGVIALRHRR